MPDVTKSESQINVLEGTASNSVQALGAARLSSLQEEATHLGQRYSHAHLGGASDKEEVLDRIAKSFHFPDYFDHNLDALADCLTDMELEEGQAGFVVMLERLPQTLNFGDAEQKKLLEVFVNASEFWAGQNVPFRVFYSFE